MLFRSSVTTPDGRVIVATTQAQADGSIAFVPAAAAAVTVAPSLPLVGFPAGSTYRPGNAAGSMPTVMEPDGTVVEAMVTEAGTVVPFVAS